MILVIKVLSLWKESMERDKVLEPIGNMEWFFQAHASYTIDVENTNKHEKYVIVYDNHVDKRQPVSFYDNDKNSHVRIYVINEKEKTVTLHKTYAFEKSSIRSNAIYEKEANSVFAMNGKHKGELKDKKGSIIRFDYDSKDILNQYSINYGFYRAYEFIFSPKEMSIPMELKGNYVLGHIYGIEKSHKTDFNKANDVPEPILKFPDTTEEESVSWVDAGTVPTQVYAQDVANVSTSKTSFVDDNGDVISVVPVRQRPHASNDVQSVYNIDFDDDDDDDVMSFASNGDEISNE